MNAESMNTSGVPDRYALGKLVMSAHIGPAALQALAFYREMWWAGLVFCGLLFMMLSSDFRHLFRHAAVFRYSVLVSAALQAIAYLISLIIGAGWPSVIGMAVAVVLGMVGMLWEPQVARDLHISENRNGEDS